MQNSKDTVVTIGNSLIQHGKHSDRVYLMSLDHRDMPGIIDTVLQTAAENEYTKVFAKVPAAHRQEFAGRGFTVEAEVPRFFRGSETGLFMARYLDPQREAMADPDECRRVLEIVNRKMSEPVREEELEKRWVIRKLDFSDVRHAAAIYREVFATYPFPIHDENYLLKTMRENVAYYGAYYDVQLVAVSSAEMDRAHLNAEMTDFATLPDYRGQNLALHLLRAMERDVAGLGIRTAYTIARAVSVGMNLTFARGGYEFAGTLHANTNISGGIESMNVWHKSLKRQA